MPVPSDTTDGGTCDQYGSVGCSEAVVYIYYGDVGGTGVEHSQKGGGTVETSAVADRSGDCDDRHADQSANDRGESPLHSGNAHIVKAGDPGVEEFGGDGSLLSDGLVAGSGAKDGDVAFWIFLGRLPEGDGAGRRVMNGVGEGCEYHCGGLGVGSGSKDVGTCGGHAGEDVGGLLRGFSLGVDDLGKSDAEGAVVVDACVADVLVGHIGEALGGSGWSDGSGLDSGEEFEKRGFVHLSLLSLVGF